MFIYSDLSYRTFLEILCSWNTMQRNWPYQCVPHFFVELISFVILARWQTKSLFRINAQIKFILWFATAEYIFKTSHYLKNCFWLVVGQKSWLQNNPIPECRALGSCCFFSELDSCSSLKPSLDASLN